MSNVIEADPGLDSSQWFWPGPVRVFSDAELARAGQQPWRRGVDRYVWVSVAMVMCSLTPQLSKLMLVSMLLGFPAFLLLALRIARWLWVRPTRKRLNLVGYAVLAPLPVVFALLTLVYKLPKAVLLLPFMVSIALASLAYFGWWTVTVLRVQQIEARLAELDEQERSVRLAKRLATAQIQPHFLFNTLASLQHWVDTQDARAATTLRAFTVYLRATLPMFDSETLALTEELQIVRSYLEVMQARLGERLSWAVLNERALDDLQLPTGALLTLVENAITHGIEPSLRGGRIEVRASASAAQIILEVSDDGAGLREGAIDGLGLGNTRTRLHQQFGERVSLNLKPLSPGCLARIEIITP